MAESTEQTHTVDLKLDGQEAQMHFFKSWTTYSHPVKLESPVSFEQVQDLKVYYEGVFRSDPLLMQVTKWMCSRRKWDEGIGEAPDKPGSYFRECKRTKKDESSAGTPSEENVETQWKIVVGKSVRANEAALLDDYLFLYKGSDSKPLRVEYVHREKLYQYRYEYNEAGKLKRAYVENKLGTKVLDF